jgi:hypothetical protein
MSWRQEGRRAPAKVETSAEKLGVGGHLDAACGKCKRVTSHVVLAKVGNKPTRVECRVCHSAHAYRAQDSSPARTRRDPAKAAKPAASPEAAWAESMRRAQGEAVPYAASGRYTVGTRVKHSRFGEGVVIRLSSPTVCEVIFSTGTLKLVMGSSSAAR